MKGISHKHIKLGNDIPQTSKKLKQFRNLIRDYAAENELIPPLQKDEVIYHAGELIKRHPELFLYQKLLAVMINNYCWKHVVEGISFDRRILLLPKCMSHSGECPAKVDELGLLCEQCGRCDIGEIISLAEELGYHVIVSEGTTPVTLLLASGGVECVIGVGCLHSLERSFNVAVKEAVPSMAIPLFNSNCKDSLLDKEWLYEVLLLRNEVSWRGWLDLNSMRKEVGGWFSEKNIKKLLGNSDQTVSIASRWLEVGGKRWRPLIMVAIYKALCGNNTVCNDSVIKLAVSVECFHKASLVHDDIADNDLQRYGYPTLHKEYDVPVALNVGDLLMGFGYQLIADSGLDGEDVKRLLTIASYGHRDLTLGQGKELLWRRTSELLSVKDILDIFSKKTAPAFEVALKFGAVVAKGNDSLMDILNEYSCALGIAYQIKDDLEDFTSDNEGNDFNIMQPSLITAILGEKYPQKIKNIFLRLGNGDDTAVKELFELSHEQGVVGEAKQMMEDYKYKALRVLERIREPGVKILLTRLVSRLV